MKKEKENFFFVQNRISSQPGSMSLNLPGYFFKIKKLLSALSHCFKTFWRTFLMKALVEIRVYRNKFQILQRHA